MEPIVDSYLSESFLGFQFATSFSMELVTETDNEVDVGDHSQITSHKIGPMDPVNVGKAVFIIRK